MNVEQTQLCVKKNKDPPPKKEKKKRAELLELFTAVVGMIIKGLL